MENISKVCNYVLSKLGACVVVLGQADFSLLPVTLSLCRLGVPVIAYETKLPLEIVAQTSFWTVRDPRENKTLTVEALPRFLLISAEHAEDLLKKIVKSCFRICDNSKCRLAKLSTFVSMCNITPEEIMWLIRSENEIPLQYRDTMSELMKSHGWTAREVPVDVDLTGS